MYKLIRKSEGLTLVEIIISLAILGIIIVPLSTLFVNSAMINRRAEIQLLANQTAQRFMEEYKMKPFGDPVDPLKPGTATYSVAGMQVEVVVSELVTADLPTEFALNVVVRDSGELIFLRVGTEIARRTVVDGDEVSLDFSGTPHADSVEIAGIHGDIDLYGDTNNPTLIKLEIKNNIVLNMPITNSANERLEIHKIVQGGIGDNTSVTVALGHVKIINHGTEFMVADRYQSAGLVITVTVERDGQQLVEMAQARKLEW